MLTRNCRIPLSGVYFIPESWSLFEFDLFTFYSEKGLSTPSRNVEWNAQFLFCDDLQEQGLAPYVARPLRVKEDLKANRSLVCIYYIVGMFWLVNTESKDQMACCAFLSGRCVSTPGTLLLVSTTAMQASLTTCDLWCESLICQTWTAPPLAMACRSIWAKVHTDLPGQTGAAFAFAVVAWQTMAFQIRTAQPLDHSESFDHIVFAEIHPCTSWWRCGRGASKSSSLTEKLSTGYNIYIKGSSDLVCRKNCSDHQHDLDAWNKPSTRQLRTVNSAGVFSNLLRGRCFKPMPPATMRTLSHWRYAMARGSRERWARDLWLHLHDAKHHMMFVYRNGSVNNGAHMIYDMIWYERIGW